MGNYNTSDITDSAIESWVWASRISDDDEYSEEVLNGNSVEDVWDELSGHYLPDLVTQDVRSRWEADVDKFIDEAEDTLNEIQSQMMLKDVGHDIALTRNHEGVGFWDRGYPEELGDKLTEIAHSLGEYHPYLHRKDNGDLEIGGE